MRHTHDGQDITRGLESLVRDRLADRIGEDLARSVGREEKFHDLGIDSLDIVTVLAALERECGVDRIADGELWDIADTVDALVRYLSEHGRLSAEQP
jgi:acyl carrier protein